jgi:hypothetical protein
MDKPFILQDLIAALPQCADKPAIVALQEAGLDVWSYRTLSERVARPTAERLPNRRPFPGAASVCWCRSGSLPLIALLYAGCPQPSRFQASRWAEDGPF